MLPPASLGTELRDLRFDDPLTKQTIFRVVLPTLGALFGGVAIYGPCCLWLQDNLDIGNTGRGPILRLEVIMLL